MSVSVSGTQVSVKSSFELTGAVTSDLVNAWQQALNNIYKSQVYKCYKIDFDLKVTSSSGASDLSSLLGGSHQVQVLDVLSDSKTKAAYEEYGLYDDHDWDDYDAANGTNMADKCYQYEGSVYSIECAEASQWFYDQGYDEGSILGHATHDNINSSGSLGSGNIAVLTNASSGDVFAHEAGHLMGMDDHSDGQTALLNPFYDIIRKDLLHENLHDMLENMNLECRWTFKVDNINFAVVNNDTCPVKNKCIANLKGVAQSNFVVESYDNTLEGKGDTAYSSLSYYLAINTANCTTSTSPVTGKLVLKGMLESGDASLFTSFTEGTAGGYNPATAVVLALETSYSQDPLENAALQGGFSGYSIPVPMLKNMMIGGGFNNFKVLLGDPSDPKKILKKINFNHSFPLDRGCIQIRWSLTTNDLVITNVEAFKGK